MQLEPEPRALHTHHRSHVSHPRLRGRARMGGSDADEVRDAVYWWSGVVETVATLYQLEMARSTPSVATLFGWQRSEEVSPGRHASEAKRPGDQSV